MPQFMIDKEINVGDTQTIGGDDAHHIADVLRLKKGDWIVLSDGRGSRFNGEISEMEKESVEVRVKEKLPEIGISNVTLAQAIIKHDKIESIIQKAVELGSSRIIPFSSSRTIPRYTTEALEKKRKRWNKIAQEASKQCGLPIRPEVAPIANFDELIKRADNYDHKLMFFEGEGKTTLREYFKTAPAPKTQQAKTIIMIGPEGGFTPQEVEMAKGHGFTTLRLGPLIMRVETAAISALTLTQHFLGHFD